MNIDFNKINIAGYLDAIRSGDISVSDAIYYFNEKIKEKDNDIQAFLDVYKDEAMKRARKLDDLDDKNGKLFGVPIAIKDNILIEGKKTTAASKVLENYYASYDATIIKKLKREGAIFLGKTNLDEFAMGSSTENSAFQITKNPVDLKRVPGGSSGGSAASVAGGMAMASLGSDTGGSIRQPAGFCGVVGLKPTYGAVSRYGLIALASSLDQIGPFSRSVKDAAIIFSVIAGSDGHDATSNKIDYSDVTDFLDIKSTKKIKIGIPKEYFINGMQKEVEDAINKIVDKFKKDKFEIKEISLPNTKYAISTYYIIMPAEASSNLARFDGIRYSRLSDIKDKHISLSNLYFEQRGGGIGEEAKRRILLGTFVLSAGYYDDYYAKAQKVRRLMLNDFNNAFNNVDVIFAPVTPTTAFKIGEKKDDPLSMYLSDIFTIPANMAGIPALSIPSGEKDSKNLPINFQLMGRHFDEKIMFSLGDYFENYLRG